MSRSAKADSEIPHGTRRCAAVGDLDRHRFPRRFVQQRVAIGALEEQRHQIFEHGPGPAEQHPPPADGTVGPAHGEPVLQREHHPGRWQRNFRAAPRWPGDRSRSCPAGLRTRCSRWRTAAVRGHRESACSSIRITRARPGSAARPTPGFHRPAICDLAKASNRRSIHSKRGRAAGGILLPDRLENRHASRCARGRDRRAKARETGPGGWRAGPPAQAA